jgi:superfamily II DNA or RNA helicase
VLGFTNVSVARRGLDLPCLEVACVVRPTRSLVLWLQMIGRIRRPSKATGKTDCIVIDHAGACDFHCMPDDEIEWSLDPDRKVSDWLKRARRTDKIASRWSAPSATACSRGRAAPIADSRSSPSRRTRGRSSTRTASSSSVRAVTAGHHSRHAAALEQVHRHRGEQGHKLGAAAHMFAGKYAKKPWEIHGMKNVPPAGENWKMPAEEVFPGFKRVKVQT